MKVSYQQLFDIISSSKSKFCDLPNRVILNTKLGKREADFDERRFIAILEAASMILKLKLDVDYVKIDSEK